MALNQTVLADEDGGFSDWIEIYNAGATTINLLDWALTDDKEVPLKWLFPDTTLNPDEYLVVFASDKDRSTAGTELHTNFKLSGSGEYLALNNALGVAVTEFDPEFPYQQTDYSYGFSDGTYIEFF